MPARPRSWRVPSLVAALALTVALLAVPAPSAAEDAVGAAATPVGHEVTVVRVAPRGAGTTVPVPVEAVVDRINGPAAEFWDAETDGSVVFSASAWPDWVPTAATCADAWNMFAQAQAAVGFEPGPGRHLLLYISDHPVPETQRCRVPDLARPAGTWGAGGMTLTTGAGVEQLTHVLGHSLGLGQASLDRCTGTWAANCPDGVRSDVYDVMGDPLAGTHGSLSASGAAHLGVLPETATVTFGAASRHRRVTLSPISGRTGVRAVRLEADGRRLWIEFRPAVGRDAWLADPAQNPHGLEAGVLLRVQGTSFHWGDVLLDGSPSNDRFSVLLEQQTAGSATIAVTPVPQPPLPRDMTGDGEADVMTVGPDGTAYVYPGAWAGGLSGREHLGYGWQGRDLLTAIGDWDGDGHHDAIARNPANGDLLLYAGDYANMFRSSRVIGRGWNAFDALLSPGDWDGDGLADVLARRRSDGALLLYPGNGRGGFLPSRQIGRRWGGITGMAACPNWDSDRYTDFVARRRDGALLLYESDGTGGFGPTRQVGSGWQVFTAMTGVGSWTGPVGDTGTCNVVARRSDGTLWKYQAMGAGWYDPVRIGTGWNGYRLFG